MLRQWLKNFLAVSSSPPKQQLPVLCDKLSQSCDFCAFSKTFCISYPPFPSALFKPGFITDSSEDVTAVVSAARNVF